MPVQTEVAFEKIKPVSEPHRKVAHTWFEKIRFYVILAVHTAMNESNLSHIGWRESDPGH